MADFQDMDTFDGRDVLERVEELRAERDANDDAENGPAAWALAEPDDAEELAALEEFMVDVGGEDSDTLRYSETFIADAYFEDYAREVADELGVIPKDAPWPLTCIDWAQAARELQMDYTSVELAGVTFWYRS